jgi:hypothetical protein
MRTQVFVVALIVALLVCVGLVFQGTSHAQQPGGSGRYQLLCVGPSDPKPAISAFYLYMLDTQTSQVWVGWHSSKKDGYKLVWRNVGTLAEGEALWQQANPGG